MEFQQQSILIIDDLQERLNLIHRALSDSFFLNQCFTIKEAKNLLNKHDIDVVICYQRLPDGTGIECIEQLSVIYPSIPFILFVEGSDLKEVVAALNRGVSIDKFIQWPCTEEQLNSMISNVMFNRLKKSMEEKDRILAMVEQKEKLANLGELVSGIAHEINNPLAFISSNLSNLNKFIQKILQLIEVYSQLDLPDSVKATIEEQKQSMNYDYLQTRVQELVQRSLMGTDRMKKILMDLKNFSRMATPETSKANINEAIDLTVKLMSFQFKEKIQIITDYGNIPDIDCNIEKLNQVFMNLLINASHAVSEKGEIHIQTFEKDNQVIIQIKDNGSGIPEDVMHNIFNPFFTTKEKGVGTGMGLYICRNIINQHKGSIVVDSIVGQGTTFTITLPI